MHRLPAMLIDFLLITAFAAIGRASHDEGIWSGLLGTVWPFWLSAALAWIIVMALNLPSLSRVAGVVVWLITAWIGVAFRVILAGETAAPSFVIVTTIVLGVFLMGWRLIARKMTRSSARSDSARS